MREQTAGQSKTFLFLSTSNRNPYQSYSASTAHSSFHPFTMEDGLPGLLAVDLFDTNAASKPSKTQRTDQTEEAFQTVKAVYHPKVENGNVCYLCFLSGPEFLSRHNGISDGNQANEIRSTNTSNCPFRIPQCIHNYFVTWSMP